MQTRALTQMGIRSAFAVAWVIAGGTALGQTPTGGMPGDGGADASGLAKFAEKKVSIDVEGRRLVEVLPQLLNGVEAQFVIDAEVKNAHVSSHLTNVKLQTVLDVLLRASDIPVQYTFEKGVFHFSKKVELPVEPPHAPPIALLPGEEVLPPPPTQQQEDIDIHNVQTYDLLRVLNNIFHVPVEIAPDPNGPPHGPPNGYGSGNAGFSGYTTSGSSGLNGHGITSTSGGTTLGEPGSSTGGQTRYVPGGITLFGHTIHLGGR